MVLHRPLKLNPMTFLLHILYDSETLKVNFICVEMVDYSHLWQVLSLKIMTQRFTIKMMPILLISA